MRKIIQLMQRRDPDPEDGNYSLVALCDDGTIWILMEGDGDPPEWAELDQPIPQYAVRRSNHD